MEQDDIMQFVPSPAEGSVDHECHRDRVDCDVGETDGGAIGDLSKHGLPRCSRRFDSPQTGACDPGGTR